MDKEEYVENMIKIYTKYIKTIIEYNKNIEKIYNKKSNHTNKINIKKSDTITMNKIFIKGRITEILYQHPHGNIHMNINTVTISYESIDETGQGQVIIAYQAM